MNRSRFILFFTFLLFVSLGCNLPAQLVGEPTNTPSLPQSPTNTPASATATFTLEPEIPPTITESPPKPIVEPPANSPIGFYATSGDGSSVTFYSLDGQVLGMVQTPGLSHSPYDSVYIAGSFSGNPLEMPVIYPTFENMGDLKQSLNGQITTLFPGPDVSYIQGAPAQYALVFTTVTWGGDALSSYFYARTSSGGGASWFWNRDDPESWAMYPLAVQAENDEIKDVFYTLIPWGIGGDIVFPPRKGLFQLNMDSYGEILHLTEDFNPIGISPDNTYVAYTQQNNVVNDSNTQVTIYDLISTSGLYIDLVPGSDRGAGYAVFSPDNQYVAWMEGSGWMMAEVPNFHSRVRIINTTDGAITADLPDSTFAGVVSEPTARTVKPVGWVDGQYLLVQVIGDDYNNPKLVKVRFDGTDLSDLTSGTFLGFLYP